MQMNVLRTKKVSHVGSRDDHGQPIAGGDDQKCRRQYVDRYSVTSPEMSESRSNLRVFETIRAAELRPSTYPNTNPNVT